MSEEYGPWVTHNGNGCSCVGEYVCVERKNGAIVYAVAGSECAAHGVSPNEYPSGWVWLNGVPDFDSVLRYRIRKPKALEQLRQIARDVETPLVNTPKEPVRA